MKRLLGITVLTLLFIYSAKASDVKSIPSPTATDAQILEHWQYNHEYLLIQEGDTWYNLGKLLNCNYELLQMFNQTTELNVQDIILIPGGENLHHAYLLDDDFFLRVEETLEMLYHDNTKHLPND